MTAEPAEPLVRLTGVTKHYRPRREAWLRPAARAGGARQRVLRTVDLRLERGEVVGVLGPNGAGKTTLLKVLAGLVRPDAGSVEVAGASPLARHRGQQHLPAELLRSGDWLIFDYEIDLWRNLLFWSVFKGLRHREAVARLPGALARVGLDHLARGVPNELSAGERQRLSLARLLLSDRPLLLLDEPFVNLDEPGIGLIQKIIRELAREGQTLVVATNVVDRVEGLCDRLLVLDGGRLLFDGPPGALQERLARTGPLKRRVWLEGTGLAAAGEPEAEKGELVDLEWRLMRDPESGRLTALLAAPEVELPRLLAALEARGVRVTRLEIESQLAAEYRSLLAEAESGGGKCDA